MNRRYAFRDYQILVTARPEPQGWRPEICVVSPSNEWEFVPTHHDLVANDPVYALEIGRLCGESAIADLRIEDLVASYDGLWH